jgi:hypothetical protein
MDRSKRSPDLTPLDFYLWGSLKGDIYRRKPATLDDLRENIAMSCAAIMLDTLQNVVHAAVRRLRQCLDADGGHFEHWIQNSRTSLILILLLCKYSSYDYTVIFFMSKCVYIFLGHSVVTVIFFMLKCVYIFLDHSVYQWFKKKIGRRVGEV